MQRASRTAEPPRRGRATSPQLGLGVKDKDAPHNVRAMFAPVGAYLMMDAVAAQFAPELRP